MKVSLVSIYVNDPIAAHAFYTEKLGFLSQLFQPEALIAIVVSPQQPDGTAILLEPNHHPVAKAYQSELFNLSLPVIVLGVDDIAMEYEHLKGKGIIFRKAPVTNEYGTEAIFEDSCGNLIQLYQK